MQITKSMNRHSALSPMGLSKLGLTLSILLTISACGTVAVEAVNSNHPANPIAVSAPETEITDILNVDAVESTEAPVMDHSKHNM